MADKKILITGGTGLLGKALIETDNNCEIIGTYIGEYTVPEKENVSYKRLDIRDTDGYRKLFKYFNPHTVIHTASIGSPDYAEKNKEITRDINVNGTKNILSLSEEFKSNFIYISSNGIYDGNSGPYSETSKAEPVNFYGKVKLEGENVTGRGKVPYAIVRPILMYGWNHLFERPNIVTIALEKLRKNEVMNVYDDVYSNPLYSEECAKAIWKIIRDELWDDFNIAGSERVSIYELIKETARVFGLNEKLVLPVKQGFFNELVPRPGDTSYNTSKMENLLKIPPISVREGLKCMKRSKRSDNML